MRDVELLCLLFENGVTQKFKVSDWTVKRDGATLIAVNWVTPEGAKTRLVFTDLSKIQCIWVEK